MSTKKFSPTVDVTVEGNLGTDPKIHDGKDGPYTTAFIVVGNKESGTMPVTAIAGGWNGRVLASVTKGARVVLRGKATIDTSGKEPTLRMTFVDRAYAINMPPKAGETAADDLPF